MAGSYQLVKENESSSADVFTVRSRRGFISASIVICTIILSVYSVLASKALHDIGKADEHFSGKPLEQCVSNALPRFVKAPAPVNIWAPIGVYETAIITEWLEHPPRGLNLTRADHAQTADNFIFLIEAYRPLKSEALAYLEDPANRPPPARFARVTIHHGSDPEPVVRDYLVGPLPISKDYNIGPLPVSAEVPIRPLTEIYHRDAVPFNARGYTDLNEMASTLAKFMLPLSEATQELFGGVARGLRNDTLVGAALAPLSFDGSFRRAWITWRVNTAGTWLHPVGFFTYIDFSGTDRSLWRLLKIVYNHQIYTSADEFLEAFHNGTLVRLPPRPDQGADPARLSWSTRARPDSPVRDLDDRPGPRSVSFAGLRFRLDRQLQYVNWMGWGMYLSFDRDMGLSLWDLRFKGERIIYELAPQEAMAQYAGNDPMQSSTAWLDRYFGMGSATRDLLPGYDCPHEAVYLPATTHGWQGSLRRLRAICIFEHDTARPLTRHTGYQSAEFGAVKGYVLVIRSISTVGNYDYLFDYMFHLDGTIEVRLSASGYLQAGFWEPSEEAYGTAIRETTMGSLHDHVINYKVDLDVAGLTNSLLHTSTSQEEVIQPWFDDEDWGQTVIQQKITRTYIDNENDALLKYPSNFQGGYALVNKDAKNAWGSPRGYAIHPGYAP